MSQNANLAQCQGAGCNKMDVVVTEEPINWLEEKVLLFFRMWHMIFLCSGGVLALIILLCCCFKCRIPRTKQEIESDFRRKKVTRKFRRELDKMHGDEIDIKDIRTVLDKVKDKFSRKYSLEDGTGGGRLAALKKRIVDMLCTKKPKKNSKKELEEEENDDEFKDDDADTDVAADESIGV